MKFNSGEEMLSAIIDDYMDLYNKETEEYVFLYNDCGSICVYSIDNDHAEELKEQQKEDGEYWGAHLGVGGCIYDDPSYEDFEDGDYSNLDWCNDSYKGEWEDVS